MKKTGIFLITIGLLIIQSCSDKNKLGETQLQISLAGKVYGMNDPPLDTTKCELVQASNDYLPKLLFLNDSSFIEIIPAKCGEIGEEFECQQHCSGKYKINDKELSLTYESKMAVYYIKSKNLLSSCTQLENSDRKIGKLIRRNCKSTLYFEMCDVQGHLMAPKSDTLANEIKKLKDEKIWDKLFGVK